MRITEKQLKQIIREESQKALNEGALEDSYTKKVSAYREALGQVGAATASIDAAVIAMQKAIDALQRDDGLDDPNVLSATLDLMEDKHMLEKALKDVKNTIKNHSEASIVAFMKEIAPLARQ